MYNEVASKMGGSSVKVGSINKDGAAHAKAAAAHLIENKGSALVVCGSNDKNVQIVVNGLNEMLGSYGATISTDKVSNSKRGSDEAVAKLIADMSAGKVDTLLIYGVDPVRTVGASFKKAMGKVKNTVSFATKMNATAKACKYVCPDNHWLESWNDANPVSGHYSIAQPTISPLFKTRQMQDSLLTWTGNQTSFYDYIQAHWERNLFPQSGALVFGDFWNQALHDGVYTTPMTEPAVEEAPVAVVAEDAEAPASAGIDVASAAASAAKSSAKGTELVLYINELSLIHI